jgi:hypothetical protein
MRFLALIRARMRAISFMYVNVPVSMPKEESRRWQPLLDWTERVIKVEGTDDVIVELHWHPENPWACDIRGLALYEDMAIVLCGTPSQTTVLHELAHFETQDGHSVTWATRLMQLHHRWLSPRRALRADRSVAYRYPDGRKVYRTRYGITLPLRGGGKRARAVVKRQRRRDRSRIARARQFERMRTTPYPWEVPGGLG